MSSSRSFAQEWSSQIARVRASSFWRYVSQPPQAKIPAATGRAKRNEVVIGAGWSIAAAGSIAADQAAAVGMADLQRMLRRELGIAVKSAKKPGGPQEIRFVLKAAAQTPSRWDTSFQLAAAKDAVTISADQEAGLLQGALYLGNLWRLAGRASLPLGKRTIKPRINLHLGADLWGGFTTTQAWVTGRENDSNYLELARVGVNAMPIMCQLEDYILDAPPRFKSLINPKAKANLVRLRKLARQAYRQGVSVILMAYNPKLPPNHPVFKSYPACRGAVQFDGAFRVLCSSDPATRQFICEGWQRIFREIPELGGMITIVGGEGFYYCFMRPSALDADDCPRCRKRRGAATITELINDVAAAVRQAGTQAQVVVWPYSAGHWSKDRDQEQLIAGLDGENIIFQTELDKDVIDWRPAGYGKHCWDYSAGRVDPSERSVVQRNLCRKKKLRFSAKLQMNNSIECLNVPYLPTFENQLAMWDNTRKLQVDAIQSRWLFGGSCKSVSEQLGYWSIWGKGTAYEKLPEALAAIARREFGPQAAPYILKAWHLFSQAMRHHPNLSYYVGSYFIGPGQPLVLDKRCVTGEVGEVPSCTIELYDPSVPVKKLDEAFYGRFYWLWEVTAADDTSTLEAMKPYFFSEPGFRALARRGQYAGQDVALMELREMAKLWQKGADLLDQAGTFVPASCRPAYRRERTNARFLAYTWHSAANVEEFLRLRNRVKEFTYDYPLRAGHARENAADLRRMEQLARAELAIAKAALKLAAGVDYLDISLRLDMGSSSTTAVLSAKIKQVEHLLSKELPAWSKEALRW